MDSGIEVTADAGLEITATGTVDLWPMGGETGMYTATPAGMPGGGQGGFVVVGGRVGRGGGGGAGGAGYSPGALLGRIGENGRVFVVGARHHSVPKEEGRLYLRIAPSSWGNDSTGTYDVRISVGDTSGR
jgi:hypothetical protein